jgi:hypothetical protein
VLGERNGQALRARRSTGGADEEAFGPLEQVSREGEEVVHATGFLVCDQLLEACLAFDAQAAIDRHVVSRQDVRRHDEAHRLDLAQPFFVDGNFGGVVCHCQRRA